MHDDGKNFVGAFFAEVILLGASATEGNGSDNFQMAWIRDEVNIQAAPVLCFEDACGADVIFHISAAKHAARVDIFKLGKDVGRSLPHDVDHHAEASAMCHGENDLRGVTVGSALKNFVEEGN